MRPASPRSTASRSTRTSRCRRPTGPAPLILVLHGYGGSKKAYDAQEAPFLPSAHQLASRGYAVLNVSDRGFGDSCGSLASRTLPDCAKGWIHLLDTRFEVRDFQYLAGLLVDQGLALPTKIGAIGESYGGGSSIMLATLKDRIMLPDGTLAPWTSPNGTPMAIAAATPMIPWSDLISSLTPNGRWLDYTLPQPAENYTPRGELKQSFVAGLYIVGNSSGFYSPPGVDPQSDVTTWNAITNAGEPTNTPAYDSLINIFMHYHGAQYVLDGEAVPNSEAPAPMFLSSGFTDDLFPVAETLRYATLVKKLFPATPLKLMYADYGHMRGQNKAADTARLLTRVNAWIDHYVMGKGAAPKQDVTVLTQTCPATAKSGGPFTARNWAGLHPGQKILRSKAAQTVTSAGGDPTVSKTFDPVLGGGACATTTTASEQGTASYLFPKATGKGYTMIGSPTIYAKMAISGQFPLLTGRLFDVAPDGSQTLVARNVFRPADGATSLVWQLNANAWHFAKGHRPRFRSSAATCHTCAPPTASSRSRSPTRRSGCPPARRRATGSARRGSCRCPPAQSARRRSRTASAASPAPTRASRSCALSTLPPGLRGSGSPRTLTNWGTLKSASCSRAARHARPATSNWCAGRRHDHRADLLAHHRVGHADDRDLADAGRAGERVLDLDAVHVLAAAVDHVLLAVDDLDEAVVVDPRQVAGVQPAVDERLRGLLGLVPVAGARRSARGSAARPTPSSSGSSTSRSTTGVGEADRLRPRLGAARAAGTWRSTSISVRPKPLPTRALGNACMIRRTSSGAIGAPP